MISDAGVEHRQDANSLEKVSGIWQNSHPKGSTRLNVPRTSKAVGFAGATQAEPLSSFQSMHLERRSKSISAQGAYTPHSVSARRQSLPTSPRRGDMPKASNGLDSVDLSIMSDIPKWLRNLRLHKYTATLENLDWRALVKMSDEELEKNGVTALGARRKLLKYFEMVLSEAKIQHVQI